ncbi:MAG: histidine phosphatase family protein [Clostridia bacterium]|nr:histidine phosphatase family protein [Clostridia bacterium]
MTTLILVRHGQSVANAQHRFAGHSNFDLTDIGKEQARLAGEYIRDNFKVDAIYASDLKRAYHTALPAAGLLGLTVHKREGLREIFAGEWETLTIDEIDEQYTEDFAVWKNDFSNARCTDGESVAEVYDRVCAEILGIARENDGKCVMIATHATPIRVFETMSMGLGSEHVGDISFCKNAAINIFKVEDGTPSVVKTNITEHTDGYMATLCSDAAVNVFQISKEDTPTGKENK